MKKIVFILSIVCLFVVVTISCKCKSKEECANPAQTEDNSATCLDWVGTYSGLLPCADCSGIETQLSLKEDNTYQITWKYMEKNDNVYVEEGTFVWDATGGIITLENLDVTKFPTMYKVCENSLLQLDLEGNVVTGEIADKYILRKNQE